MILVATGNIPWWGTGISQMGCRCRHHRRRYKKVGKWDWVDLMGKGGKVIEVEVSRTISDHE